MSSKDLRRKLFPQFGGKREKRTEPSTKPKSAIQAAPAAPRAPPVAPSNGAKCFSFGGKTYCE